MSTIGSNIAALKSLHNLRLNEDGFAKATERLSSGKRLNNAGDDAAGAAIVNRMSSQIAGMNVAIRNAGDAISMSQVAEGALHEVSEILQRMRELAVQAANGSYSGADRVSLNQEIVSLKKELIRIGETTTFNTTKLLNGTFQDTEFEISFDESPQHTHSLSIEDIRPNKIGIWNMSSQVEKSVEVASVAAWDTEAVITTTNDHNLKTGDIVTYQSAFDASGATGEQIFGLTSGISYAVKKVSDKTFSLTNLDGTAMAKYGTGGDTTGFGDGTGAKFHLNSLGNGPAVSNTSTPVSSDVLGSEELDVYGYVGKATARFKTGATARDIASSVNALESKTGVYANASTHARVTLQPDNSTDEFTVISFDIYGMNTTAVPITATVKFGTGDNSAYPDLSDLRDKINGFSGDTGINARLSADGSYLDLTSPDGHDIVIDGFDLPNQSDDNYNTTTSLAIDAIPSGADPDIVAVNHPFKNGDIVRVDLTNTETSEGLVDGRYYVVKDVRDSDSNGVNDRFKIATYDANGTATNITMSAQNKAITKFTKIEKGFKVQTLDRDENPKGVPVTLVDKEILASRSPAALKSVRLTGQVNFESSNVFTVTPAIKLGSVFRDAPDSASLRKISDMDVLSVRNAQRMMSAVDGALRKVDAERGDLGATMNRMEHTIDNLSNIVVNTTVSRGRIEDADMAEESVNLSKSQVLQQAATAMLAQANQSMQSVLDLLR